MSAPGLVCWWEPDGWRWKPATDAFTQWQLDEGDYAGSFKRAGYYVVQSAFPPEDEYSAAGSITVWRHATHLLVDRWDTDTPCIQFLVAQADIPAFRNTVLLQIMQAHAAIWQAEEVRRLRRAVTAWVRHGHGERTIESSCDRDKDERTQEEDLWAARRAREKDAGK